MDEFKRQLGASKSPNFFDMRVPLEDYTLAYYQQYQVLNLLDENTPKSDMGLNGIDEAVDSALVNFTSSQLPEVLSAVSFSG